MSILDPKFVYQDGERVLIDVRKAALAGAREIEVYHDAEANAIKVVARKSKTRAKGE